MDGSQLEAFIDNPPEYSPENKSPFETEWKEGNGVVSPTGFRDNVFQDGKFGETEETLQKYNSLGIQLARKGFKLNKEEYDNQVKEFKNELRILRHAKHYHVVSLVYAYTYREEGKPHAAIIMPYVETTLHHRIDSHDISEEQMFQWMLCLAKVLEHLHGIGIRHRDIKPLNILVSFEDRDGDCTDPGPGKILLADFGISKMGLERTLSTTQPGVQKSRTQGYCAPEVEDGSSRGQVADIFSMGAVFMEIYTTALKLTVESIKFHDLLLGKESKDDVVVRNVAGLQDLLGTMKKKSPEESWQYQFLGLCQEMLDDNRTKRPDSTVVAERIAHLLTTAGEHSHCSCMKLNHGHKGELLSLCRKVEYTKKEWSRLEKLAGDPKLNLRKTQGAIQLASARGPLGTVKLLLDRGFDVDLRDFSGQTALHCAAGRQDDASALAIVDCILSHASEADQKETRRCKVDSKDSQGRWPIHHASGRGNAEVVKRLLREEGINHAESKLSLSFPKKEDHGLEAKDYDGRTALHHAASGGHVNVIEVLMCEAKKVFGITDQPSNPGKERYKEFLDRTDNTGRTSLHLAAQFGSLAAVKCLSPEADQYQADANKKAKMSDGRKWAAIHFSVNGVRRGGDYREVTKFLLRKTYDWLLADPSTDCKRGGLEEPCECERDYNGADLVCEVVAHMRKSKRPLQNLHGYIQPTRFYNGEEMSRISEFLEELFPRWHENGHTVARIYTVLSISDVPPEECETRTDELIQHGITDYRLPLAEKDLPAQWSPGRKGQFCRFQAHVLSQQISLEELDRHSCLEHDGWRNSVEVEEDLFPESVFRVRVRNHPISMALKLVDVTEKGALGQKLARSELKALKRVRHDHIVSLEGSFSTPRFFGILMTPAADCNLEKYLKDIDGSLNSEQTTFLANTMGCLTMALRYLHDYAHITHYDIKPPNILVNGNRVLLADFGISYDWSQSLKTTIQEPTGLTNLYCAPEVMYHGDITSSADIWSLGCVFLEIATILTGSTIRELQDHLRRMGRPQNGYWKHHDSIRQWGESHFEGTKLEWILKLLEPDSRLRPTAATLCGATIPTFFKPEYQLFGQCCTGLRLKSARRALETGRSSEAKRSDRSFKIDHEAGLAVLSWPGQHRLYFEDTDHAIREVIHDRDAPLWLNTNSAKVIGKGKPHSPIAATTVEYLTGLRQKNASRLVRVFFLNDNNQIQERIWEPLREWRNGPLCTTGHTALSSTGLGATSWGNGRIVLCYQAESGAIRILHTMANTWRWHHVGDIAFPPKNYAFRPPPERYTTSPEFEMYALSPIHDTSMVLLNFEFRGRRRFRLYYQGKDRVVHELCLLSIEDIDSRDADDFQPGDRKLQCEITLGEFEMHLDSFQPPGGGISAIVFMEQQRNQIRVYIQGSGSLVQAWYSEHEWIAPLEIQLDKTMMKDTALKFVVGLWGAEATLYFLKDGGLGEFLIG